MEENSLKYVIHQNYDTAPKLFGVFSYSSIIISLFLVIPIIYLTYISSFTIITKIYISIFACIPIIILNYVFSSSNNLYILLFFVIKYIFSTKVYIYNK